MLKIGFGAALVAGVLASPAGVLAQEKKVRMQVASAFPGSLALLGEAGHHLVNKMRKLSSGSIDARFFEPGALVPASQYLVPAALSTVPIRRPAFSPAKK